MKLYPGNVWLCITKLHGNAMWRCNVKYQFARLCKTRGNNGFVRKEDLMSLFACYLFNDDHKKLNCIASKVLLMVNDEL